MSQKPLFSGFRRSSVTQQNSIRLFAGLADFRGSDEDGRDRSVALSRLEKSLDCELQPPAFARFEIRKCDGEMIAAARPAAAEIVSVGSQLDRPCRFEAY